MSSTRIEENSHSQDSDTPIIGSHHDVRTKLPIPWQLYWDECTILEISERGKFQLYKAGHNGPVLFLVHGGGYTALSWSILASKLKHEFRILALDMRGHGGTLTNNDNDFSIETLVSDVTSVMQALQLESIEPQDDVVLIGHSMGGAVTVRAAATSIISSIKGVVVLDVVEGTALASLPFMKNVINKRPTSFKTLNAAVEWALTTKMSSNKEAAQISIPSMLKQGSNGWIWRTLLLKSEPYWTEWYIGLSQTFLNLSMPKLLLLAGTDRLDKTLTVGQMQGKFQLALLPTSGHAIHEDDPERVASHISQFTSRFRIGKNPLPFLNNKS